MMDADKDGIVTAAEMDAAHTNVTGREAKKTDMSSAEKIKGDRRKWRWNVERRRTCSRFQNNVRHDGS